MSIANVFERSLQRAESYRTLTYSSLAHKGANPVMSSANVGGGGAIFGERGGQSGSALHVEQYRYYRGWSYTGIRAIATRIAGQQIFVARKPSQAPSKATWTKEHHSLQQKQANFLTKSLPLCYKNLADQLEPIETHPLLTLLSDPNEIMVPWSMQYVTVANLQITGKGFWWFDLDGEQPTVWPIPSSWVTPGHEQGRLFARWFVRPPGAAQAIIVPGERMAYFSYPDPSDPLGAVSPLQAQALAISTDEALQQTQYHQMKDGVRPDVILKAGRATNMDGSLGQRPILMPEQRRALIDAILLAHRGPSKRGEPAIVDGLIEEIVPYSHSVAEMDYMNSGGQVKARVMQGLGVNPIVVGEIEGANRASAAVADENFCSAICNPLITMMSQVLTGWVGPVFAQPNEQLVVWIDECRSRDQELRLREWDSAANLGCVTGNEYRVAILNLPPRDDLDELTKPAAAAPEQDPAKPLDGEQDSEFDDLDKEDAERKKRRRRQRRSINPYTLKRLHV